MILLSISSNLGKKINDNKQETRLGNDKEVTFHILNYSRPN